jgi:membrane-bound lytic murein transglycosylase C
MKTALLLLAAFAVPSHAADAELEALEREAAEQEQSQRDADPAARMAEDVRGARERQAQDVQELSERMRAQYERYLSDLAEQRARLEASARRQWTDFQDSTTKTWVDYGASGDARSAVDFEKGRVEVEVLVPVAEVTGGAKKTAAALSPAETAKLRALAEKKLERQTRELLAEKDAQAAPVLEGQLAAADGAPVTEASASRFVHETLAPRMVVADKPVVAGDGTPRLKVTVVVPLVPDHLKVRARRYDARVRESAARYGLDAALVFAVIQTESEFNPRARSQAPAFGLMQLMPKTGAYEAYRFLYKEDKIVSPDYLYDPDNNILLGATYLHLLRSRHFGKVRDAENQRTLMIAAYNCGPGCVRKHVLSKGDPDALSNAELLALVQRTVPQETKLYVPRVRSRMAAWKL